MLNIQVPACRSVRQPCVLLLKRPIAEAKRDSEYHSFKSIIFQLRVTVLGGSSISASDFSTVIVSNFLLFIY